MVEVSIVHDEVGRIVSITRPSKDANVVALSGDGQSVFVTQVDEGTVLGEAYAALDAGETERGLDLLSNVINNHRVDRDRNALVEY